jgi:hypothetical protein
LFEVKIKNKPNIFFPKSFSDELGGVLSVKTSPIETTEYKSIVMTIIQASKVFYQLDLSYLPESATYLFRLRV